MVNVLKFRTLLSFYSQIKCWLFKAERHKKPVRIANREDPDQTASSETVLYGSALLAMAFFEGNYCSKV